MLATVETEDVVSFAVHGFLAPAHGFSVLCGRIFLLAHLRHSTAAVPSIRRVIGFPERVAHGKCHPIEGSVFRAHLVILGRAVLQVVPVAILAELFPLRRHGGRSLYEVVFGVQIVGIVGVVDLLDVIQKAFERLFVAILIEHGRESLVELVERLDAREDVVGAGKPFAHLVAHLYLLEASIKDARMGGDHC